MGLGGWSSGGCSLGAPSQVYYNAPVKNYQDLDGWFEEFANALGAALEIWQQRFISAQARANLLDPNYAPIEVASSALATATAAPVGWPVQDTMLDVLAYAALAQYPLSPSLTVAQKQALVGVGWDLLSRKGNRIKLLKLVSKMTEGVIYGWTLPPSQFSLVLPDGAPDAGYGDWVPQPFAGVGTVTATSGSAAVTGSGTSFSSTWAGFKIRIGAHTYWIQSVADATHLTLSANAAANAAGSAFSIIPAAQIRPWLFEAIRNITSVAFPGFVVQGIGYSQFRAGYSAAGEPVLPSGARLGVLVDEHFSSWAAGALVSWSTSGVGTYSESQTNAYINHEFSNSCVDVDLTAAAAGSGRTIYQSAKVNNQYAHRVQFDYAYYNAQGVNTLRAYIKDVTNGTYYDPATATWGSAQYFALPVSDSTPTRKRYAIDVALQSASSSAATLGTARLEIGYAPLSDGTATTQTHYYLYRIGLYEKFDEDIETQFDGDPIGYWPLIDAPGRATMTRTSATLVEPANYDRSKVKIITGANGSTFDYHPALTGRGFRSASAWTNLISGSNDFGGDWTTSNCTVSAGTGTPDIGGTASQRLTLTANGRIYQNVGVNPTSKSYVAGVWMKSASPTTAVIELVSTSTLSQTFAIPGDGDWHLYPFTPQTFGGGDVAALTFQIRFPGSSATVDVFASYLYEVTGKTDVLYPPVVITAVGTTDSVPVTGLQLDSAINGTNVLHPLTQRTMISVAQGAIEMTIVPTFSAASQPNQTIFQVAESTAKNSLLISTSGGSLTVTRRSNSSTVRSSSITLTSKADPAAGSCTWVRDTPITIRVRWFSDGSFSLSAGSSSASHATTGDTYADSGVANIYVGCTVASINQFDGIVRDIKSSLLGAPTT